mmetsp:Transcript_1842/g.4044  ORF Transcript_1842/g.4044 Transcript_1842/m.4044 type:complete len:132 (+) Transcript_1842:72-467(+)|eukprot:scaffold34682_cov243-Amphora_coffeaeformis.AAC.11
MTATYDTYPRTSWQDPSVPSDPWMTRQEQDSYRDTSSGYREQEYSASKHHHKVLPPEIQGMKNRRKRRTVASGVAGGIVGLVALGPIGGIAGGIGGAMVAKRVGKRNEKKRMDRLEAEQNPMRSDGTGEML